MSDKLVDRLRGKYKIGPEGEYGTREFFANVPPICEEAAKRIEELEAELNRLELIKEDLEAYHMAMDDIGAPRVKDGEELSAYGRAMAAKTRINSDDDRRLTEKT